MTDSINQTLDTLRADLQARADTLGYDKWKLYDEGLWTGYLNALQQISPHCSKSEDEAYMWYGRAVAYFEAYKRRADIKHER